MLIVRFINWVILRIGPRTLGTFLLLFIALSSAVWTLSDLVRGLDLALVLPIAFGGLLLSWNLAAFKPIPGWLAGFLALILGVEGIIIRVGRLERLLVRVVQDLLDLIWQLWRWPIDGQPDTSILGLTVIELWSNLNTLLTRLLARGTALTNGEPAYDPVANILLWSFAIWIITIWAGWAVRRLEHPLAAVAPAGALAATALAYSPGQSPDNLLLLLGATLLLVGLIGHGTRERRWLKTKLDIADTINLDLALAIVPISIALIALAGTIPSISIEKFVKFSRQLLKDQTAQVQQGAGSFGLRAQFNQSEALQPFRAPGLPRSHLLGSGPELSEQVALVINTGSLTGATANDPVPRYYWRSITYDSYNGRGWVTSQTEQLEYEAGEPAITESSPSRRVLRQAIQIVNSRGGLLYAAGDVVVADHDYSIDWRGLHDPFAGIIGTNTYRVDSLVPVVTADELRTAGSDYPEWVQRRFLHLPDTVPDRILMLARDLTATAPTPYDRAKAIEAHLRTFPYNLDLPEPPVNQDMVDYFLFDLQQGYCDYYATSMIVLARAAGLPARMAVGYASGTYDAGTGQYIVTEADAHSWVEIYFPEYGWIEFEPTAAQPVTDRSGEPSLAEVPEPLPALEPAEPLDPSFHLSWWLLPLSGIALLILAGFGWSLFDGWRLRRLSPTGAVAMVYTRLERQGQKLAVPFWAGETPYEYAAALTKRVEALIQDQRWATALAPLPQEIRRLTKLYVQASYSDQRTSIVDQIEAIKLWQRLRRRLWLVWISNIIRR